MISFDTNNREGLPLTYVKDKGRRRCYFETQMHSWKHFCATARLQPDISCVRRNTDRFNRLRLKVGLLFSLEAVESICLKAEAT